MADVIKYEGTTLGASIVPGTSLDKFATHQSEFGKGGWHEVATVAERDAIPAPRLSNGMAVYVSGEDKLYIYKGNSVWEEFKSGISGISWGEITGDLSNQNDLNEALNLKQDTIEDYTNVIYSKESGEKNIPWTELPFIPYYNSVASADNSDDSITALYCTHTWIHFEDKQHYAGNPTLPVECILLFFNYTGYPNNGAANWVYGMLDPDTAVQYGLEANTWYEYDMNDFIMSNPRLVDESVVFAKFEEFKNNETLSITDADAASKIESTAFVTSSNDITFAQKFASKQDNLNEEQLAVLESGITAELVASIGDHEQAISDINDSIESIEGDVSDIQSDIESLDTSITDEVTNRESAVSGLQSQIDAITSSSDVRDVVGTYTALEQYDTSVLGNNDIVKVLQDETKNDAITYYRWVIAETSASWVYIGSQGPFYTKSESDANYVSKTAWNEKQDKLTPGDNITIIDNVISSTGGGESVVFDYTTNTTVGGLPKDTNITGWTLSQVMKQMLSPTAVTEPTLTLTNKASTSAVAGTSKTFAAGTIVASIAWSAGTSTNPGAYTLTGTNAAKFEIDGTNIKLKASETFTAGTTSALTFGVSRTYDIINSMGVKESKTKSATNGSLSYTATYPSYVGVTEDAADTFIGKLTSAITLPSTFTQKATKNSPYTSYAIPDKNMLTFTNRLVIINKGSITSIKDSSGDITGNFKIESKTLTLAGSATETYAVAVLINPSAGYKETLTIA